MGQADHVHEVARTNPLAHKSKRRKQETAKVEANGVARRRHFSKSVDQTDVAALQKKAALGSQNVVIVKDQHALFANTTKAERWASGKTIGLKLFRTCAEIRHSTRTKGGRACSAAKGVALVSGELSWMAEKIAKLKDDRRQAGGGKSPTSPRSSLHQPPSNALPHPPHSGNNIIFQDPRQVFVQTDQSQMPVQEISADASGLAAQPSYPSSLHTNIKVPSEAGVGAQAPQASL
ncbi:hypothetical protein IWX47DRAFT_845322 [Phyllosticta citricarpa]